MRENKPGACWKPAGAWSSMDLAVRLASAAAPQSSSTRDAAYGRYHRAARRRARNHDERGTPLGLGGGSGMISKLSIACTVAFRLGLVSGRWRLVVTSVCPPAPRAVRTAIDCPTGTHARPRTP